MFLCDVHNRVLPYISAGEYCVENVVICVADSRLFGDLGRGETDWCETKQSHISSPFEHLLYLSSK